MTEEPRRLRPIWTNTTMPQLLYSLITGHWLELYFEWLGDKQSIRYTIFFILLLLKIDGNARLGENDRSEDHSPTIPMHRMEEEKGKTGGDKMGASS